MGKGFAKGFDPRRNIRGRRKGTIGLPEIVRLIAAEPRSTADKRTKIESIIRATFDAAVGGDMKAVEFIADRGWGKPVQPVDQTGEMKITTRQMTDAELAAEIEALDRKIKDLEGSEAAPGEPSADPAGPA